MIVGADRRQRRGGVSRGFGSTMSSGFGTGIVV